MAGLCRRLQRKARQQGAPRERPHLQELRSAGPGLGVLVQRRLQEVSELRGPGGRGSSKLRATPRVRLTPGVLRFPNTPVQGQRAPSWLSGGGGGAVAMTLSSWTSLCRRDVGTRGAGTCLRPQSKAQPYSVPARAPHPGPRSCPVAAGPGWALLPTVGPVSLSHSLLCARGESTEGSKRPGGPGTQALTSPHPAAPLPAAGL